MVVAAKPDKSTTGDSWCTPKWLADLLGDYFDVDPCSNTRSHIRARIWHGPEHAREEYRDGLARGWVGSAFVNPPFSNVQPWAIRLALHPSPWCALVKLDPTTRWWATLMSANPSVAPFKKRIKFEGDRAMTANFPCCLVWKRWAPSDELAKHLWLQRWG